MRRRRSTNCLLKLVLSGMMSYIFFRSVITDGERDLTRKCFIALTYLLDAFEESALG